ncbi:MAG: hypothetical protein NTY63_02235 [Candidatus Bipolaricaulota bacterium]|nr:hypothetical protein [Candidatus Bipolaricaulota bacterium]
MNVRYVVLRTALVAVLGTALYAGGLPWWAAVLASVVALLFFLVASRSGRYVVESGGGVAPLRRDERSQTIRDRAARNAFILTILGVAGLTIAYGRVLETPVPVAALSGVLGLAVITYIVSDVCLRRSA